MQAPWLSFVGIGVLFFAGCSSTLDEYRCTENTQCIDDEGQGICHTSGYCAFVDFDECDGYRFGDLSGERSGLCVGAESEIDAGPFEIDAGPGAPDANPNLTPPTASIAAIIVECEQTKIDPDGRNSEAFGGATLKTFAWTIRSPTGAVVSTLTGSPGSAFEPNALFLSGVVANPGGNLTPYMDDQALKVHTEGDDAAVSQLGLAIPAGSHRLSFAVASAPGASTAGGFDYAVLSGIGLPIAADSITLTEQMTTYALDFNSVLPIASAKVNFHATAGEYWLDNVRIQEIAPDGSEFVDPVGNSSFEDGTLGPWMTSLDKAGASAAPTKLLAAHTLYGNYEVELIVTDSNDQTSEPASVTVNHAQCLDN